MAYCGSLISLLLSSCLCNMKQELEGVLPEVQLLCQALLQREIIFAAVPGRRLKGVAFAPELQVSSQHLQFSHQHASHHECSSA